MVLDLFTGTGSLSASWTNQFNTCSRSADVVKGDSGGDYNSAFWNADTVANDQFAQAVVTALGSAGTDYAAVTVRNSGTGTSRNHYAQYWDSGGDCDVLKAVNGTYSTIAANNMGSPAVGTAVRLEVEGTTLRVYVDGTQQDTDYTDASLASGAPGLSFYHINARLDDFVGGALYTFDCLLAGSQVVSAWLAPFTVNLTGVQVGDLLLTCVLDHDVGLIYTITGGGTWSSVRRFDDPTNFVGAIEVFQFTATDALTSIDIEANDNGTESGAFVAVLIIRGNAGSPFTVTPQDAAFTADSTPDLSITTTVNPSLLLSLLTCGGGATVLKPPAFLTRYVNSGNSSEISYRQVADTGSYTADNVLSSAQNSIAMLLAIDGVPADNVIIPTLFFRRRRF